VLGEGGKVVTVGVLELAISSARRKLRIANLELEKAQLEYNFRPEVEEVKARYMWAREANASAIGGLVALCELKGRE
jgi:hypothetical protein